MDHTLKARLLVHMDEDLDTINDDRLRDYIWDIEQLLYQLRQRQILNRNRSRLQPFTRP